MLILLYVMDSLRRDVLGCYGDGAALTPNLDRFAAGATRFAQAWAAAPWSKPSATALLTGQWPRAVRMRGLFEALPAAVPTLAEVVQAQGFQTVAVSANPFVSHDFGLLRAFQVAVEAFRPGVLPGEQFRFHANHFRRLGDSLSVAAESLVLARSAALHGALLDALPSSGPCLALCWSMDTHAPFFVRGERSLFGNPLERLIPAADPEWLTGGLSVRELVALYRDMVAYNDATFGALVASLQARGLWDEALVVVVGDHGEGFGEHGTFGHTHALWEAQLAVPLLAKWPGQRAGQVGAAPVSLVSLLPTVEALLGLAADGARDGAPLSAGADERPLLAESPDGWALRVAEWKAVAPQEQGAPLLFNLRTDPAEQRPLPDDALRRDLQRQAHALRQQADQRAATLQGAEASLDDALTARLRALGYL